MATDGTTADPASERIIDVAPGHVNDWYATNAGGNGQDIYQNLLGNILRIDVNSGATYAGQSLYEEIDLVTKRGNYGWNVKEGSHCFSTDNDLQERSSCPVTDSAGRPLIDPVIELVNAANPKGGGVAVTIVGGNVYRGDSLPSLQGRYIFGSFSQDGKTNAKVYSAKPGGQGAWPYEPLAGNGLFFAIFDAVDSCGISTSATLAVSPESLWHCKK